MTFPAGGLISGLEPLSSLPSHSSTSNNPTKIRTSNSQQQTGQWRHFFSSKLHQMDPQLQQAKGEQKEGQEDNEFNIRVIVVHGNAIILCEC
jgi:hypothetical protein